jgi:hypothetical protein
VEGLVLLRMIKHCRFEASSQSTARGSLLGFESNGVCEITNCFARSSDSSSKDYDGRVIRTLKDGGTIDVREAPPATPRFPRDHPSLTPFLFCAVTPVPDCSTSSWGGTRQSSSARTSRRR